jgi:uncharacterized membrane protein YkoI
MRQSASTAAMKGRPRYLRPALLLCVLAAGMTSPVAWAKKHKRQAPEIRTEQQREVAGRCPGFSLDQVIAQIERKNKARVVRTDVVKQGGECTYVLRLLSDEGRVWTVRVDSRSGGL